MFICSECGSKYEIKPKYCNCGNDIFVEDIDDVDDIDIDESELDNLSDGIIYTDNESVFSNKTKNDIKKSFSPVAIGVFSLCIILSLVVLFFIGNPKEQVQDEQIKTESVEKIEIPSIDTYWDNTVAKVEQEVQQKAPEHTIKDFVPKIVEQIFPQENKQLEKPRVDATIKKVQPAQQSKQTKQASKLQTSNKTSDLKTLTLKNQSQQAASKNASTQTQKSSQVSKTQQTTNNSNTSNQSVANLTNRVKNNIQYSNSQNSITQNNSTTVQKVSQAPLPSTNSAISSNSQNQNSNKSSQSQSLNQLSNQSKSQLQSQAQNQTQSQAITVQQQVKTAAQIKQEVATYKKGLQNSIGRKIDFTKVVGDGECVLTFKVNSSGKLYSKAFTKQSSNLTLNNAAFNALNVTTSYNPPPEGYNGETLTLKIRFYNGNFEITLI